MARKEIIIEIMDRSETFTFCIREMPCLQQYDFMLKAALAIGRTGIIDNVDTGDTGGTIETVGQHIAAHGLSCLAKVDYNEAKPLLEKLLGCCARVLKDGTKQHCTPETIEGYVEDVKTIFKLQMEAVKLNFNFFSQTEQEDESESASPVKVSIGKPAVS